MASCLRRAEGGLSVNRPLSALTADEPPMVTANMPPQMSQMAPKSLTYRNPMSAISQTAAPEISYRKPLAVLPVAPKSPVATNIISSGRSFQRPLSAEPSSPPEAPQFDVSAMSNVAPAARAFVRPLTAVDQSQQAPQQPTLRPLNYRKMAEANVQDDPNDYWSNLNATQPESAHARAVTEPVRLNPISTSSFFSTNPGTEMLFGSQYMPEKSLLSPEQIDRELQSLKELLDAGFLQDFQFEERKASLIKQKKYAFATSVREVSFGELTANLILDADGGRLAASSAKRGANRNVRVFVSSTFRDMGDEREALLKHVFPQIQRACRERGIYLTPVDLRWGITSDQTSDAQTINICLNEVDRCRPYFITLLGGRYGWAQPLNGGATDELLKRTLDKAAGTFPWIRKFANRSVTELEIRHALLNELESSTAKRGLVYLKKDASDDDSRLSTLKKELLEHKSSGSLRSVSYYRAAEELKTLVLRDLMALIDEDFAISETPTPLQRERSSHDAFEDSRCHLYISRPSYFSEVNGHLLNPTAGPLTITGEAGIGKSAFLCNWAARYRHDNPDKLVVTHYIGCTADSSDLSQTLVRIMSEIKEFYKMDKEIPTSTSISGLIEKFPEFLSEAGKRRGLVLVFDALDQLDRRDSAHDLLWLPPKLPEGVNLILSTQPGTALDVISRRKWRQLQIQPLPAAERQQFVTKFLTQCAKTLMAEQLEAIINAPQCANPLFLRTLMEELRVFGSFEELNAKIKSYLIASSPADLFLAMFRRLEGDFNSSPAVTDATNPLIRSSFVSSVLTTLLLSRKGLTEVELLECLNLSQAQWSPLFLALEESLVSRSGFLSFFHDYMKQAVQKHYASSALGMQIRRVLISYFSQRLGAEIASITSSKAPVSATLSRAFEEIPYQLATLGDEEALFQFISKPEHFRVLARDSFRFDLIHYVRSCNGAERLASALRSALRTVDDLNLAANFAKESGQYDAAQEFYTMALSTALRLPSPDQKLIAEQLEGLGYVQRLAGKYKEAAQTLERCLAMKDTGEENSSLATSINSLAIVYRKQGKYEEAEKLYNRALELRLKLFGAMHADVAQSYNSLGCLHQDMGRFAEAEKNLLEAIRQRELLLGANHPDVAMSLFNLGNVYLDWSRYPEAVPMYDRALEIYSAVFGESHPYIAQVLNSMAGVQQEMGKYDVAEGIYQRALKMRVDLLGDRHPDVALTVNDLAVLYSRQGKFDQAEVFYKRALQIRKDVVGEQHADYAQALKNLATVYQDLGRFNEALPLFQTSLEVYKKALGERHPNVASGLTGLAGLLQQLGRFNECIPMYTKALEIYAALAGGAPDADMALTMNDFAVLYYKLKDFPKAEETYLKALDMYERCFGLTHPDVAQALVNLGQFYKLRGEKDKAKEYFARAYEIYRDTFGPDHPKAVQALVLSS